MPHRIPQAEAGQSQTLQDKVASIPLLAPPECNARLEALGYRGQGHARRAASVLAYRHVRRLQRLVFDRAPVDELPARENYLFIGPTGCGKTFLVELLFREILKVPTVTVDVTQYSETGYIGEDVNMILAHLYEEAGQDLGWAACGAVCLDEFDKLASSRSNARFAGEGTTKDVSGFGVQRGLLTLLAGDAIQFPTDFGYSQMGSKLTLPLCGTTFIACGAFSGLKATADLLGLGERIGFGRSSKRIDPESISVQLDEHILEQTAAFARYGFLPELIGRFSRVLAFEPLDAPTLRAILHDGVISSYQKEFGLEGLTLEVEEEVVDRIVERAKKRELGARGLRAALVPYLEEAAYRHFGSQSQATGVRLRLCNDAIEVESVEGADVK